MFLLIYLFSFAPSILVHHHKSTRIAYHQASACEKAIYFAEKDLNHNHKTHLTKAPEKCVFCDNHIVTPHSFDPFNIQWLPNELSIDFLINNQSAYFLNSESSANRGPPTVSSSLG
jgi:hypothetical protein